jgi:hypothetical protein
MATVWQKVRSDKQFNPDHVNQILREKEQLNIIQGAATLATSWAVRAGALYVC